MLYQIHYENTVKFNTFYYSVDSGKMDLTLMILLLKQRPEDDGKKEDDCQLDVIDRISREIIQSSSGILNEIKFKEIMEHITKVWRKHFYF